MIFQSDFSRRRMLIGDAHQNVWSRDGEVPEALSMACTGSVVLMDYDVALTTSEILSDIDSYTKCR